MPDEASPRRRREIMLQHALDAVRFGPDRTLNLRASLPSEADAVMRAEAWLRERQASGAGEVLIITGRGHNSPDGVSVVRTGVARLLSSLRRRGVIAKFGEHSAGSFAVHLAPLRALLEAPRRRRESATPRRSAGEMASIAGLTPETRRQLERLAVRSLETLGAGTLDESFIAAEMRRQFGLLAAAIPPVADRDRRLASAIDHALREFET
jgi:hypothetical protein